MIVTGGVMMRVPFFRIGGHLVAVYSLVGRKLHCRRLYAIGPFAGVRRGAQTNGEDQKDTQNKGGKLPHAAPVAGRADVVSSYDGAVRGELHVTRRQRGVSARMR